ncbi:MAG: hypothetical protein HY740_05215 [Chloroflexi bacterium]|nr:hypothetical protein [Chloroflexota bacterium]
MNGTSTTNRNLVWLAVAAPIFLCALAIIAATSMGAAYVYTQSEITGATASAVFAVNAQRRLTQTAVQIKAQEDRLSQTATSAIQKTEVVASTATQTSGAPQGTATPTPTATFVFVGFTATPGKGTIVFRECRGKEGSVQVGDGQPRSLHAYTSTTYSDIPTGKYRVKVDFPAERDYNFTGDIEVRAGTQVIPFGECKD